MTIVRRAVLPALLLMAGLAALVGGAAYHRLPVWEERESETTISLPDALPPPFGEASPFGPPLSFAGADAFGGLPMRKEVVKRKELVATEASEPSLIREITVGGVALMHNGELKRTYSGKAPSLCPT